MHLWQANHSDQGQYGDGQQTQQGWSVSGNKSERNEQLVVALAVGQVGVEISTQNILHQILHRKILFTFVGNSPKKSVQHLHLWSITQAVWVSVGERVETQELPSVRHPGSCDTPSPSVRPSTVTLWQGVTLCDTKAWHSLSPTNWLAQTINQPGKLKWSQSAHFCLSQHYRWAQESLSRNLLSCHCNRLMINKQRLGPGNVLQVLDQDLCRFLILGGSVAQDTPLVDIVSGYVSRPSPTL